MEILVAIIVVLMLVKFLQTQLAGALVVSAIVCALLVAAGIETAFTSVFLPLTGIIWALVLIGENAKKKESGSE